MRVLAVVFSIFIFSCASVHQKEYAKDVTPEAKKNKKSGRVLSDGLIVSGGLNTSLTSKYFVVMEFSVENKTSHWVEMSDLNISFDKEFYNKQVVVSSGIELQSWKEGIKNRKAVDDHNNAMIISAIGAAAALGSTSSNSNTASASRATLVASGTALTVMDVQNAMSRMHSGVEDKNYLSSLFPPGHILSGRLKVPPGLFFRRWVLFQVPDTVKTFRKAKLILSYKSKGKDRKVTIAVDGRCQAALNTIRRQKDGPYDQRYRNALRTEKYFCTSSF